MIINLHKEKC